MINKDKIQTIYRFLEQPLSIERRKEKNSPMVYPNRSMRRKFGLKKKDQTKRQAADISTWFERWTVATIGNIQSGQRIHDSYVNEIVTNQGIAERKLYERQLEHFIAVYGKAKATVIMDDMRSRDIAIIDKKIGL